MLIYKQDGDVLAILREALEGVLDRSVFRLLVDDEKVLLGVRRSGDVLMKCWSVRVTGSVVHRIAYSDTSEEESCHGVLDWR